MDKQAFLYALKQGLAGLPGQDIQKHIEYYDEIIDDRMEDGLTEQQAVDAIGDPGQIAAQLRLEAGIPASKQHKLPVWTIVLLVVGAPVWFSLLVAAVSVVFSLYVSLWAVLISLYTAPISLGAGAVAGIAITVAHLTRGNIAAAIVLIGMALACAGLCIFTFMLCNLAAKGTVRLTKWSLNALWRLFRKEAQK